MLTMHAEPHLAVEALSSGASGFMLKNLGGDELLHAIEIVLSGGTYLPQDLTKEIVTLMVGDTDPNHVELTLQQREVLRLVVLGHRAKEIASTLDISTRSVESIKYKTMQLLNVHSTAELVRYAVEHKLVPL
jgi:DNA-binding NarL/FixJ family response regulator